MRRVTKTYGVYFCMHRCIRKYIPSLEMACRQTLLFKMNITAKPLDILRPCLRVYVNGI